MAQTISLLPNASDGLVDEFGNGLVANYAAEMFTPPAALAAQPQSQWYIAQWGQAVAINSADYTQNNASTYDPNYGNALYSWSEPGTTSAIAIYQNTPAAGGGDVYDLTDANTTAAPSSGATEESDMFLSSPGIDNANLSHPITLSLDAKITQSLVQFASPQLAANYATSGTVFGTFDIGLTVNFNGADGLANYVGFVQIVPWTSDSSALANYTSGALSPDDPSSTQFISSTLLPGDPSLSLLPADAGAAASSLSYNINEYVYASLQTAFADFSPSQQAALLNLSNWTLGGVYVGPATNDAQVTSADGVISLAAAVTTGIQVSNITVAESVGKTYNPAAVVIPVAAADINPLINYSDSTLQASGTADGSTYSGPLAGIQDKFIYTGADNISLTAPVGANWEFGGGSGATTLTAISGDNVLIASTGGSTLIGGAGTDAFVVPDANLTGAGTWDSIANFNVGDTLSLAGMAGPGWTYSWYTGNDHNGGSSLTLLATSTVTPGLNEMVTLTGLSMSDLSSLTIAPDATGGGLTITRGNPQIASLDLNSGAAGSAVSTLGNTNTAGISAEYLYTGTSSMAFMAPAGANWEFGGGSAFTQLSAISGNNIFVASTGGSFMLGGSGNDIFDIPDANLTGAAVWDSITNFHAGDSISLAGLAVPGWTYSWTGSYGSASNPALTLQANSTVTPGLSALVTLNGLSMGSLASLSITHGTGADAGTLIVSR
jgi:hypothetical protein